MSAPPSSAVPGYPPFGADLFVSAMQLWNQGQQEPAKAQVQPAADAGNPAAAALLAWFIHQQGEPGWRGAIPYADAAISGGYPQAAGFVVGNMMNDPNLRAQALDLARRAAPYGLNYLDPLNQAIVFSQQGDISGVEAMLSLPSPGFFPGAAEQWSKAVEVAQNGSSEIQAVMHEVQEQRQRLTNAAEELVKHFADSRTAIDLQSGRLKTLITQTTNAQASSFFDSEATTAEKQAETAWNRGVAIVFAAAVLSLLPLMSHYAELLTGHGVELSETQTLGAHLTAAIALTAVSGVLLTRSRVRDRNRQRNRDLSVALNTMFAYGEQIEDAGERQRFIHEMGRTVIEAYLQQESASSEDAVQSIIGALARR